MGEKRNKKYHGLYSGFYTNSAPPGVPKKSDICDGCDEKECKESDKKKCIDREFERYQRLRGFESHYTSGGIN